MSNIDEQLIIAVKDNKFKEVYALLRQSANPAYNNSDSVQWAARNGNLDILKLLIAYGADVSADNNNALYWAKHNGHLPAYYYIFDIVYNSVLYLVYQDSFDKFDDMNVFNDIDAITVKDNKSMQVAAMYGNVELFEYLDNLITTYKGSTYYKSIQEAVEYNHINILEYIFGRTPYKKEQGYLDVWIMSAAKHGYLNMIIFLMDQGGNVTSNTLYSAVEGNQFRVVRFLIKHGVEVNEGIINIAISRNNPDIIEYFKAHKYIKPGTVSKNFTSLRSKLTGK